ncbi:MAG TPA: bifunctional hydroxymethylpyrimidine kinase/phosphomethylpyrimidine kinase [Methylocystis sp.]|nr:bifunctional hydroxymethylpyrimidine kinase/phosphomethylpyrimidine kinase [Methylocystis sp.]HXZ14670.1 bifunctional hydroxymethylpyrimidine kinase/phosphomethylpyrimidine kinase [Roseiarcus sp.]
MRRPRVLAISGSDPSGGAGAQADIKTFAAFGCYGMAAITALTVQNTRGVRSVITVEPDVVAAQVDAIFEDVAVDAVKIGMLGRVETARAVAASLRRAGAHNVVVDPVLAASHGAPLAEAGLAAAILAELAPLAALLTPNLAEAASLTGTAPAGGEAEMGAQARALVAAGARAVLVKGGHLDGDPVDLLWTEGAAALFRGRRIETRNTHGTGCALSSAIACCVAQGMSSAGAVERAKRWLEGALLAGAGARIGGGSGPPDHLWNILPA